MLFRSLARSASKVQSDLKQRFITLAWPELQKSAISGMGFHIQWLRLLRPKATHVERAQRGPLCRGGIVAPAVHHVWAWGSRAEVPPRSPVLPVLLPVQISGELKVPVPGENKRQWDRNWAPEVPSGSTGPGTGTSGH